MQQARYPPPASFWVFSPRISLFLTLACTSRDPSYSPTSLINVNTPRCENCLLKQGCDSGVQEHLKSSSDHLVSSLLLNFPLPTLQNKCNIIHFPDSFSMRLNHLTVNLQCWPLPSQLRREFFPDSVRPLFPVFVQFLNVQIWLRACLLCPTGILCMLIQRWIKINILIDLPEVIRLRSAVQFNLQKCAATMLQ